LESILFLCAIRGLVWEDIFGEWTGSEELYEFDDCFLDRGFTPDCAYVWASTGANSALNGCTTKYFGLFNIWREPTTYSLDEPYGSCPDPPDQRNCYGPPGNLIASELGCSISGYILVFYNTVVGDDQYALNECLACDEELCGELFAKYAARTRRNSGILIVNWQTQGPEDWVGLKRDCDSIADDIIHEIPAVVGKKYFHGATSNHISHSYSGLDATSIYITYNTI
jgi:hypothetical protein